MAKGDPCKVPGCLKKPIENRNICSMHKARYRNSGTYDYIPKSKVEKGFVKFCSAHGQLKPDNCLIRNIKPRGAGIINKPINKYTCKECSRIRYHRWVKNNPGKRREDYEKLRIKETYTSKGYAVNLKKKFGISLKEYEVMFNKQNGKCAMCKMTETWRTTNRGEIRRLCVDHDHETGKIRELLCTRCNTGYGMFCESESRLQAAIDYGRRHGKTAL